MHSATCCTTLLGGTAPVEHASQGACRERTELKRSPLTGASRLALKAQGSGDPQAIANADRRPPCSAQPLSPHERPAEVRRLFRARSLKARSVDGHLADA
jgi:hypothetical protein